MNPMMLQGGLAGPLVFGLVVFTALRRRTTPVHHLLLALLSMILVWMVAMLLHSTDSEPLEAIALQLTLVPMCAMSPLFLVMMGHYARLDLFERRWDTSLAILAPFGVFYLIFLTNPWHRMALVETGADALFDDPMSFGGPFYWAFQFWSNLVAACGLGLCGWLFLRASSRGQRIRVLLLSSAVLFPLTAHLCFVFRVLPIGFALTPSALGMTALLVVLGIGRYRLWEFQPLVRRDVIEVSGDAVILVDDLSRFGVDDDQRRRLAQLHPGASLGIERDRDRLRG